MTDSNSFQERVIHHILAASDEDMSPADVTAETSLRDDLDLSSMQAVTLVMDLEDEFEITVEDEELEKLKIVGDVFALIDSKRGATD